MQDMDEFIEQILIENGITQLDDDVKKSLVDEMRAYLIDQINAAVIAQLPDDKIDEFQALVLDENTNENNLGEFFKNSGVDIAQITLNTLLRFRNYYKKGSNQQ